MKQGILLFLIFISVINAQDEVSSIYWEHHSQIFNEEQQEIVTYRIPYNILSFTKNNDNYESNFSFTVEIYDSLDFILREINTSVISTPEYSQTTSFDNYFQDLIRFNIIPGKYTIKFFLSVDGIETNLKIPEKKLVVISLKDSPEPQLFITKNISPDKFILANFSELIPLSPNIYSAFIALNDTSVGKLIYSINQFNKKIVKDSISSENMKNIILKKDQDNIVLDLKDSKKECRLFFIKDFSKVLNEGKAELEITIKDKVEKLPIVVNWINKPKVLNNPEYSIKLLGYIEDENVLKTILSKGDDNYYQSLLEYWNEKYPANGTKYNYAMNEFYKRADYAIENFSTLNSVDGSESDRGKIYIVYGKPTVTERNYTEKNEIVELWTYEKLGRSFLFKDETGTGKFILTE